MNYKDFHLSDEQLLQELEGEASAHDTKETRAHLELCWKCRARRRELDQTITKFIRIYQQDLDAPIPPIASPRAKLRAHLAEGSVKSSSHPWGNLFRGDRRLAFAVVLAVGVVFTFGSYLLNTVRESRASRHHLVVSMPDATLTPGATLLASRQDVCGLPNAKNKAVPTELERKVFKEYGIARTEARAYEIDYLITPALGGADDIRNLWPHSYAATVWNAHVKDALEDRLRGMVCEGNLDLREAQQELAENWIAAYKKYFHTDQPLSDLP